MIGMLTGTLAYKSDPFILLDVAGVGYKVLVTKDVMAKFVVGELMRVFTYTHVREDVLELYGFSEIEDLKLFEYLISVSGVGCKSALGVFGVGKRRDIVNAIIKGDVAFFTTVPRLGKKNSQKIIIELKNKFGSAEDIDLSGQGGEEEEILEALKSFGFTIQEAQKALRAVDNEAVSAGDKLRLALKYLGR